MEIFSSNFDVEIFPGISEDGVWRFRILENLSGVRQNIIDICQYGFTEMFNNAIDHSEGTEITVSFVQTYAEIRMTITDDGVGIFQKIQRVFNLSDPRSALLELSKGKLTSDRAHHTGEGIFFTSRMFDHFRLGSGQLFYMKRRVSEDEWLVEIEDTKHYFAGTTVQMAISTEAHWTPREIFERFEGDEARFRRTHVPILLGKYPGEQLVSRSQAKRILARFDNFSEVLLDFQGVQQIGQAFADEIFRVFRNQHPDIKLVTMRTEPEIEKIINSIEAAANSEAQKAEGRDGNSGTHQD